MFYEKAIWTTDHLARLGITANLLIGAYLTPSRLIASLCYKNRCYTQNFVRVNGCCWWIPFVCLWLVCYRPSVCDPFWFQKLPHDSPFFLKLQPMIHSLGVIILACFSTFSKHRFYKPFWQSRIPLILSQIVNMVTSSSLYLFDLIPWPSGKPISHAGYTYAIFIFHFPKLLHVSSKPFHLKLSFRCTILSSAMAHHPFFYQVFSSLFLWYFFSSYTIRQNLLITFWWIWILYGWTLFLPLVTPEDVATDH